MSSPSPRIFKDLAKRSVRKKATVMKAQGRISLVMVKPDKLPMRKDVILMDKSVFKSLMVLIPALRKVETVIPARIIVVLELSDKDASKKIEIVVRSAPRNAAKGVSAELAGKNSMESMTKKPEPEFTPIVFGLARELFITLCKITPAEERAIPENRPPSTLGIRTVVIKIYAVEPMFFLNKAAIISVICTFTLPKEIPAAMANVSKRNKSSIVSFLCFFIVLVPYL